VNLSLLDSLLVAFNATPMDVLILFMGIAFATFVIFSIARAEKSRKESNKAIWDAINENKRKYAALNAWTYGASVAIRVHTGVNLLKQSADGQGETALNRDIE
jgi:hypothetical protein